MFDTRSLRLSCLLLITLLTAACGGGGGGKSSANASAGPTGNAAPTIQGKAGSQVIPGQTYSFQPVAKDSNGDTLTFSATNLPGWATFDATTGRLSGMPASADIAAYSGITITVTDGKSSASLAPFTITVSETAAGTASLTWLPPTQNSDGSALADLVGYEIRYGLDKDDLGQTVALDNPSVSTYLIENLWSGTWYFAVVAVNRSGVASPLSNVASKTIG